MTISFALLHQRSWRLIGTPPSQKGTATARGGRRRATGRWGMSARRWTTDSGLPRPLSQFSHAVAAAEGRGGTPDDQRPWFHRRPADTRAIDLLASNPKAFVIAGGQNLMPVLAFRLATPSPRVDLRRLPGLGNIAVGDDGFRLGALVRWRDIEDDERLAAAHPLLHTGVTHVAHYQIRNRGTVGGSLAHADPAAELPGVA